VYSLDNFFINNVMNLVKRVGDNLLLWQQFNKNKSIINKKKFTTEADVMAHNMYIEELNKLNPNIQVISEENYNSKIRRENIYWLIDPIDGTRSWFEGFPGFVTQIALISNTKPVLGIIYSPSHNKLWHSIENSGAFLNKKKISIKKQNVSKVFVDNYPKPNKLILELMNKITPNKYLESGSLGLKAVYVCDGTADIFVKGTAVRDWDLAPALSIGSELGIQVATLNGIEYQLKGSIQKKGLIFTRDYFLSEKIKNILISSQLC